MSEKLENSPNWDFLPIDMDDRNLVSFNSDLQSSTYLISNDYKILGIEESKAQSWISDYDNMVNSRRKKIPRNSNYADKLNIKIKNNLTIEDALCAFRDLKEKGINEFILTGSVALFLQNKITRSTFKDIDLISLSQYEMDDDMQNYARNDYDPIEGNGEQKSMVFNSVLFDVFSFSPEKKIDTIEVKYGRETYLCQDYKQIIMAKLRMILPKMKDSEELFKNSVEINFK